MKILDNIKTFLGGFLFMTLIVIIIVGIGVIVGLITKNAWIGFFTIGGIIVLWALWGAFQEFWAWIHHTGIYEKDNKEE
jgi:hypothetical protein